MHLLLRTANVHGDQYQEYPISNVHHSRPPMIYSKAQATKMSLLIMIKNLFGHQEYPQILLVQHND